MKKAVALAGFALILATGVLAQRPETPAGQLFSRWVTAFNSGDAATMDAFFRNALPGLSTESWVDRYKQTGGYEVVRIEEADNTRIVALARERNAQRAFVRVTMSVNEQVPDRIASVRIVPTEPPADLAPRRLTATEVEAARGGVPFRQFEAWLEAINAPDPERYRTYLEANFPRNAAVQMTFRSEARGLDFRKLEQVTPWSVTGLVETRSRGEFLRFTIAVDSAAPHAITQFIITAIPRPAEFAPINEAEALTALADQLERELMADRFAGAVLVAQMERATTTVLFSAAYGLADRDKRIANRLETRFQLGSMNMMFTAAAVLQLVQAGKVKLSDPVGKYITDYPNQNVASKVTIHQLLTHTGGTGDFFGPDYMAHRNELKSHDEYVALFGSREPLFEPGSRYEFSNYGMILLGVVIERVSGQSYYDYVADHVYKPAGMTRTGSDPQPAISPDRAIGYTRRGPQRAGDWVPNTESLGYRGTAAGGGFSTVGDLLKFAEALMTHRLLDSAHTALLIEGKVSTRATGMYAYGFVDNRTDGAGSVGHGGGVPGMSGDLRIYPASGHVVVVLSNLDPPAAPQVTAILDDRLSRLPALKPVRLPLGPFQPGVIGLGDIVTNAPNPSIPLSLLRPSR